MPDLQKIGIIYLSGMGRLIFELDKGLSLVPEEKPPFKPEGKVVNQLSPVELRAEEEREKDLTLKGILNKHHEMPKEALQE